jgi:broad specificity phosphatase PhoE
MLRADDTLHFFTSPYRRTRETTEGILETLTSDEEEPSPFKRSNIKVHEEPRLREQDFGNFQPCSAEMERMWQERADYGHFFYRIPNGESAADAYDRVSGFNESLYRQFGEDDFASVCVLVTHGLMSRVFLMKWYHFSVEYFEDLRNVNHCEFLIMKKQEDSGKYILQNKLRTWSALRRERAALRAKEDAEKEQDKEDTVLPSATPVKQPERQNSLPVVQRRWGGCPEGCNHSKHLPKIRRDLAELRLVDEKHAAKSSAVAAGNANLPSSTGTIASRRGPRVVNSSDDDSDDPRGKPGVGNGPKIDVTRAREELVSSPDGTPSFITVEDRLRNHVKPPKFLHVGRDFGGTHSGANSDTELSEDDARQRLASIASRVKPIIGTNGTGVNGSKSENGKYLSDSGMGRGAQANRLGDAPASRSCSENGSEDGGDEREENGDADEQENEEEDLDKAEKEDRSIRGSVY